MHRRSICLSLLLVAAVVLLPGTAQAATVKNCPTGRAAQKLQLQNGDTGACVLAVQRTLIADGLLSPQYATGEFYDLTKWAVTSFQIRVGLPADGIVGPTTMTLLSTVRPALNDYPPVCLQSPKALCVDKRTSKLRYFVAGKLALTLAARFGDARGPGFRTKEGIYTVLWKVKNGVSAEYNNAPMPDALYFNNGAAVHYSPDFAVQGYKGASHGCVNIRDRAAMERLFAQVPIHTPVIVYS